MAAAGLDRRDLEVSFGLSLLLGLLVGLGGLAMGDPYSTTDAIGAALFAFFLGLIVALSLVPRHLSGAGRN